MVFHTYPDGLDVEIFNIKSLKIANKFSKKGIQKEGVTRYFRDNINKFKTKHISCPKEMFSITFNIR